MARPKKHYLEKLSEELSLALGEAVWAFGKIETLTYKYIKKLSKDDLIDLFGHQSIGKRIDLIKKLINRINGLDKEKAEAISSLNKVTQFISDRNTLAHNPWLIWIDFELNDFVTEIQNVSNPSQKLNLEGVKKFTVDVQELTQELRANLNTIVKASRGF